MAARLADNGFDVVIGSRSRERAVEMRDKIVDAWPDHDLSIEGADNAGAAAAEVVIVATPWDAAGATAASVGSALSGKVVVSMANALATSPAACPPIPSATATSVRPSANVSTKTVSS